MEDSKENPEVKSSDQQSQQPDSQENTTPSDKEIIEKSVDDILTLYKDLGGSNAYIGEKVTQLEHALQCALQCQELKLSKEAVIAALLHDIGHLIGIKHNFEQMGEYGTMNHEGIGGKVLRKMGICEQVCDIIENHVMVKRYLAYTDEDYYNNLSDASKKTFLHQGGLPTKEEIEEYALRPNLELYVQIRKCDEKAKVENMKLPDISEYREMMVQCFY